MGEEINSIGDLVLYSGMTAGLIVTFLGILLWRGRTEKRYFVDLPNQAREKVRQRLKETDHLGNVIQAYWNEEKQTYKSKSGFELKLLSAGTKLYSYDPIPPEGCLDKVLREIETRSKSIKADAFSISEQPNVHGNYVCGVSYHKIV